MADVLITVDTEMSPGLHGRGWSATANRASSVWGRVGDAAWGIDWQMDVLDAHGLRGVFFIDPLPALVFGADILPPVVEQVVARGHEAQLHLHTEWLRWIAHSPVGGRQGRCLGNFALADQVTLLRLARDLLEAAGAPRPIAFRAGNYGADTRTVEALDRLRFAWDSSANPAAPDDASRLAADIRGNAPRAFGDLVELPVSTIHDRPGRLRPAQVCALSAREMRAALAHAAGGDEPFVVVTHSFEMLSRDRGRPNGLAIDRFRRLCATVAAHPGLRGVGFRDLDRDRVLAASPRPVLGPNRWRTWARRGEQALGALQYERGGG